VLLASGTKSTDKWNLKVIIRLFDKEEKEFDEGFHGALEAYKNASWRMPSKSPKKHSKKHSEASKDAPNKRKHILCLRFPCRSTLRRKTLLEGK
jgi:hypothetical protein